VVHTRGDHVEKLAFGIKAELEVSKG